MAKKQTETSDVQEVSSAELDDEESLTGKETQVLEKKKKKDKHLLDWMLSHRNPSLFFFRGADGEANILHNLLRKYYLFLEVFPLSCLWRIKT